MHPTEALCRWNRGLEEPLVHTIEHARREIPFYRVQLPTFEPANVPECLVQVPLLTKRTAMREKEALRLTNEPGAVGRFSTGTTRRGGDYFDVQRVRSEDFAVAAFMISQDFGVARDRKNWNAPAIRALSEQYGRSERPSADFDVLHLEHARYEAWPHDDQPGVTPVLWSHHPNCVQSVAQLLAAPRYALLRAEPGPLVKLTMLLQDRGFDVAGSAVDTLGVYGYLTPRWRAWLENAWQATVIEVFSMSELRSVARECAGGGHFHFDELPIVTEVVDPVTGLQVGEGCGELVVSTLYPFAQHQPLLRYATGDLVEIVACDRTDRLGFAWCGRLMHALPHDGALIGERRIMDVLDAVPEIARAEDEIEKLGVLPEGTVGWPVFRMEPGAVVARVCFSPRAFLDRTRSLEQALSQQLDTPVRLVGPGEEQEAFDAFYRFESPLHPFVSLL